jgi:hypothetical protein
MFHCHGPLTMTLRYKLRTLLILLALLPPMLWFGWTKYEAWRAEQERQRMLREIPDGGVVLLGGVKRLRESVPRPQSVGQ